MDAVVYTRLVKQLGSRTDASNATGSLHAKTNYLIAQSNIKSVQRGTLVLSNSETSKSATISAVTMGKTRVCFLGASSANANQSQSGEIFAVTSHHFVRLILTNSTTITATRYAHNGCEAIVSYEVIEYY